MDKLRNNKVTIKKMLAKSFLSVLLTTGSQTFSNEHAGKPNPSSSENGKEYLIYVSEIVKIFAEKVKTEFHLYCKGDGGCLSRDVAEISVMFACFNSATIEEVRELEVSAVRELLNIVNHNEKVRPFLQAFPFNSKRVDVSISFDNIESGEYFENGVAYVSLVNNTIRYYKYDKKKDKLIKIAEEPFEEAEKIYNEIPPNKRKIWKTNKQSIEEMLADHAAVEKIRQRVRQERTEELRNKYGYYNGNAR